MNMPKLSLLTSLLLTAMTLTGCGSIQSAAEDDCSSIGWMPGTAGYERCVKDRIYERKLDYSLPPGDKPSPSLI